MQAYKGSKNMNLIFCKFKKAQKAWNSFFFFKPKKLKKHESNFYEAVKSSKWLKTASKDPVLFPGKCSSFWTESVRANIPAHCILDTSINKCFITKEVLMRGEKRFATLNCHILLFTDSELANFGFSLYVLSLQIQKQVNLFLYVPGSWAW